MAKTETVDERVEPVETTTPRQRGLALAGIIGGAVVVAGLLFGGGVLVGTALPHGERGPMQQQGQQQLPPGGGQEQGPQRGPQQGDQRQGPPQDQQRPDQTPAQEDGE